MLSILFCDLCDLERLIDIYDEHHAVLSVDTRHYRDDDAAAARKQSETVYELLAEAGVSRTGDATAQIKSLIAVSYAQVLRGASFIYHDDNKQLARFPSLYGR